MTVSRETAVTAKDSTQNSGLDISLAALRSVIDLYNRTDALPGRPSPTIHRPRSAGTSGTASGRTST